MGFGCRVSGFRPVLAFLLLTPDTRHLSTNVQFSCNPSTVKESLPFSHAKRRDLHSWFYTGCEIFQGGWIREKFFTLIRCRPERICNPACFPSTLISFSIKSTYWPAPDYYPTNDSVKRYLEPDRIPIWWFLPIIKIKIVYHLHNRKTFICFKEQLTALYVLFVRTN
jgi:hypothetical protein